LVHVACVGVPSALSTPAADRSSAQVPASPAGETVRSRLGTVFAGLPAQSWHSRTSSLAGVTLSAADRRSYPVISIGLSHAGSGLLAAGCLAFARQPVTLSITAAVLPTAPQNAARPSRTVTVCSRRRCRRPGHPHAPSARPALERGFELRPRSTTWLGPWVSPRPASAPASAARRTCSARSGALRHGLGRAAQPALRGQPTTRAAVSP
jgi:hypothetical protein